jgi:hypothetical protein
MRFSAVSAYGKDDRPSATALTQGGWFGLVRMKCSLAAIGGYAPDRATLLVERHLAGQTSEFGIVRAPESL